MCIDLVAFTYEIFRGALFQSLDGIIISANCKLRKIFTLKSKPKDTAKEDGASNDIPPTCQLNSDVPRVTQVLNMDEIQRPEIKLFVSTLIFFFNLNFLNLGILGNRGQGNICNGKTQDVSHIAFGSKILGPPPSLNRRTKAKVPGKVRAKFQQHRRHFFFTGISFLHCILDPEIQTQKTSVSGEADFQLTSPKVPSPDENSHGRLSLKNAAKPTWEMTSGMVLILCYFTFQFYSSSQFTYLELELYVSDKWVFPERFTESFQLDNTEHFGATGSSTCCNLSSVQNASIEHHSRETPDHHRHKREVFTFLSKPRSPPYGKSPNVSLESDVFPLELELDSYGELEKTKTEDSFEGTDSSEEVGRFVHIPLNKMSQRNEYWKNKEHSKYNFDEAVLSKPQSATMRKTESISFQRSLKPILSLSPIQSKSKSFRVIRNLSEETERYEGVSDQLERSVSKTSLQKVSKGNSCLTAQTCEYDRKKYQSNRLSSSEVQMLASMKRQQNEELQDAGISHGLSASQIDCCSVNRCITSDDHTAAWNSCFPPPVSQEHHYQKEMSPLSHSNPRNWLNVFSPPIIPGSQQLEENTKSSTKQGTPDHLSAEEDEVLTLLYDPCLNCYFDLNSGKYYELA
uniref:Chromosome 3 open reading frame 67 n=1 Tax=Zosterops lateralis melanops TaxID=1220523 RepID=A0A8D2PDJ5_ZOSLA